MSERSYKLFINDMLSAVKKIEKYCEGIEPLEMFSERDIVVDAVLKNLEIIGEAAGKIPESIREKYSEIPWKSIVGLRNVIVHGYLVVDLGIIWTIITKQLPVLKKVLERMMENCDV